VVLIGSAAWAQPPYAVNQCPCASWPASTCVGSTVSITVNDPRPWSEDYGYGDQGSSTIAFTLDGDYEYGCFANAFDVWVLDDGDGVKVTAMNPPEMSDPTRRAAMVDVTDAFSQGWDAHQNPGALFDAAKTVSPPVTLRAIAKGRPVSLTKMDSLPSSLSNNGPVTKFGYTLTALPARPPDNGRTAFRPPWTGDQPGLKPMYSTNDIRWDRIPDMDHSGIGTGNWGRLQTDFNRFLTWCRTTSYDFHSAWNFNVIMPHFNVAEYGTDNSQKYENCPLTAFLTYWGTGVSNREKDLVIASIQQGIDLFWALKNGNGFGWYAGAGFSASRLFPPAFAAVMLDDPIMTSAIANRFSQSIGGYNPAGNEFGEDGQIYRNPVTGAVIWGEPLRGIDDLITPYPGATTYSAQQYWEQLGRCGVGGGNARDPVGIIDGGCDPGQSYQGCCSTASHMAVVIAAYLVPEVVTVLRGAHDEGKKLFDYVERYYDFGIWSDPPDPCSAADPGPPYTTCIPGSGRRTENNGRSGQWFSWHGTELSLDLYNKYRGCLRTLTANDVGQPALGTVTRACPGQAPVSGRSPATTPPPPLEP